jgi:flagellar basal-body rod protein FlgC
MSSIFSIAASGLAAASRRLEVSASNVANALDNGPLPGAPNPTGAPPAYVPQRLDQTAVAGGGTATTVTNVSPSYVPSYDPTAPYADKNGQVAAPNVDLASEAIQQITARYAFAANAKVLQVGADLMKTLLDIKT